MLKKNSSSIVAKRSISNNGSKIGLSSKENQKKNLSYE